MAAMAAPEPFDHLRHAALDLLDAGNSTAAVAQLLAVPAPVVVRWRTEPTPPPLEPAAMLQAASGQGRHIGFRTTLVVTESFPRHLWRYTWSVGVLGLFAIGLIVWWIHRGTPPLDSEEFFLNVTPLACCAVLWLRRNQPLLVLDARAIVVPRLIGRKTLPYADLADWWLVMHVRREGTDDEVEGRMLTLHSRRAGVRPVEVFIADHVALDPQVPDRLDMVKKANQGVHPLTPMGEVAGR
jgi:hypothetical protein